MKKTLLLALVAVFALTGMAFAEDRVEVKVTSEPIQFHALCDKGGGFSLEFDTDTQLLAGDVITIDVDFGVTLCRPIDLEISPTGGGSTWATDNVPLTDGPFIDPTDTAITLGAGAYFRLFGVVGTQRITLSVEGAAIGVDGYQVGSGVDDTLILDFLDQQTNADYTNDGIWIEGAVADTYDVPALLEDNTLCINVSQWDENTVDGNMDSQEDKYTFIPSDPQIAHVVAAVDYDIVECDKIATGMIEVGDVGGQGLVDTCTDFDWDDNDGYCTETHSNSNLFVMETTVAGTYYDTAEYQVEITVLTDGVYFTTDSITGEAFAQSANACDDDNSYFDVSWDAVDNSYFDAEGAAVTSPVDVSSTECDFEEDAVRVLTECSANLVTMGGMGAVALNIPSLKYNFTEITLGDDVIIEITLIKCPCGVVWTKQLNLGTFGCPDPEGPAFELLYPYGTAMAGDAWWDGFVVTNLSSTDGTANLYFYEADGDQGTMVVSVPMQGMFVGTFSNMLTVLPGGQVVQAMTQTGGSGVLGDSQLYVIACTDFSADGFIFMGNGVATARGEAMGYLPRYHTELCSSSE